MPRVKPKIQQKQKKSNKGVNSASSSLKDLFVSQVRVDILKLLLLDHSAEYHVREITRQVDTEINAVRRELENLMRLGLLVKTPRKNRLYYRARRESPLHDDLLALLVREEGLGRSILNIKGGAVRFAFVSLPFLKGRTAGGDDVDVLIVGDIPVSKLEKLIGEEEAKRGYEINYAVLSQKEYDLLRRRKDPFLMKNIFQPKIILTAGSEEYLTLGD